jgi:hypothetical protein
MPEDDTKDSKDIISNTPYLDRLIEIAQDLEMGSQKDDELIQREFAIRYLDIFRGFYTSIREGTSDTDEFLSITAIERLVSILTDKHSAVSRKLIIDCLKAIDESKLIEKKKLNTKKKE